MRARIVAFLVLVVALLVGWLGTASSAPSDGIRVPSLADFNALDQRVTDLEQRPVPTVTVTPTPTETPTTPPPTTPTDPPTTPAPSGRFPTAATAGVPTGWTPTRTINGDHRVTTAGATVSDLRINGSLIIAAPNVTVRRVEVVGGVINNWPGSACNNGLTVEDTTIRRGARTTDSGTPVLGDGGYTARNVLIDGAAEGFRAGGKPNCGPVTIVDSYARVTSPDQCADWHGDGIQGYGGAALTVRNTVLVLSERNGCAGTAAFFVPANQGNTSVDIDGLIVQGGGYPFRLGVPGSVKNLHVVNGSWGYGPAEVTCSRLTSWSATIATLDGAGQPVAVRTLPC